MGLSNYQLVLLDNLIYLDTITKYGKGEGNDTMLLLMMMNDSQVENL